MDVEGRQVPPGLVVIRLYNITKKFPSGRVALDDVSFHMYPGEFAIVTGPSGSGKSALLSVIFGAERPCRGQAIVNGRNLARLKRPALAAFRRELGLVFQDPKLIERRSVVDNVALAAEVAGLSRADARRRAMRLLGVVGLDKAARDRPSDLSAGQRHKASLARALVNRPILILADEPAGSLDPDARLEIIDILSEVNRSGTTVLMATHDPETLSLMRCRTLLMYEGRLAEEEQLAVASL